jgi:lysozyme
VAMPDYLAVFAHAKPLIKSREGFSAKPYRCPAGKPTIGYGTTRYPSGRRVTMDDPAIDESWAAAILTSAMRRVADELRLLFRRDPTPAQYAAILSLAYNVGVGAQDGVKGDIADSTLLEKFNGGDLTGAADEFPKWCKARVNGEPKELAGLKKRRAEERELFLS